MKKIIVIIALIALLASCAIAETVGMANPMTEFASIEEVNAATGLNLTSPGIMGVIDTVYATIDCGDYVIGEYQFNVNGYDCFLRGALVTDIDISGWYVGETTAFDGEMDAAEDGIYYVTTSDTKLARWFNIDGQYVLGVSDNGDYDMTTFMGIAEELADMTNSGVTASDLTAIADSLVGSYEDETSQRAAMDIAYDENGALVAIVSWSSSAEETTIWTMTLTVGEDGTINYTDGLRETYVGETVTTDEENQAGFFTIDEEGAVCWNGAPEESCVDCRFLKMCIDAE